MPVIVITGHGDVPLAVEAMKLGAFDFIEKPFDDATIFAAVEAALREEERREENEAGKADVVARLATLSQRERQVLDGLVAGLPEQDHRLRSRHQPTDGRGLSRQRHDQDGGGSLSDLVRMAILAGAVSKSGG